MGCHNMENWAGSGVSIKMLSVMQPLSAINRFLYWEELLWLFSFLLFFENYTNYQLNLL